MSKDQVYYFDYFQHHPWLEGVENDSIDIAEWVNRISKMPTPTQWKKKKVKKVRVLSCLYHTVKKYELLECNVPLI
jgi:hypothetical protein